MNRAEWFLRAATEADLAGVRRLLAEASLPQDGLEEFFPAAYVIAVYVDGGLVGVAGLETHGAHGLLRSVAVRPSARGRGIGEALVRDRLARALTRRLIAVHLLTTTAGAYFRRFGFEPVERGSLPPEIRCSVEFTRACPDTAVAMRKAFGEDPGLQRVG